MAPPLQTQSQISAGAPGPSLFPCCLFSPSLSLPLFLSIPFSPSLFLPLLLSLPFSLSLSLPLFLSLPLSPSLFLPCLCGAIFISSLCCLSVGGFPRLSILSPLSPLLG